MAQNENTITNQVETALQERDELLKDIKPNIIRAAWFISSHLLIEPGAHIVHAGCMNGDITYVLSVLNPDMTITGIEKTKRHINRARMLYNRPNLTFKAAELDCKDFKAGSIDAIINVKSLHKIYSGSQYSEQAVMDTLRQQFKALKNKGFLFIEDYTRPPPQEYVLLEMPDIRSEGETLDKLSEPDLLVWYSENARPKLYSGCGGFFMEELPAHIPKTRLFRLPYKWAYEFIMRKDDRLQWEIELPIEYTFFTKREYRKAVNSLGARLLYSAPRWDEATVKNNFHGHFRVMDEDGKKMGYPPTSFVMVAQKFPDRKSLSITERRASSETADTLNVTAVRNEETGKIREIVTRESPTHDILPYRIAGNDRLIVMLHEGLPRGLTNAVPRNGKMFDDRRWSGHLPEAISVDTHLLEGSDSFDHKKTVLFCRDYLGVKPSGQALFEKGPDFYPDPRMIDENIHTFFLKIDAPTGPIAPKSIPAMAKKFQDKGQLVEYDAQDILNAISVGMIPNARLELQILTLFEKLGLVVENWTDNPLSLRPEEIENRQTMRDILKDIASPDKRFKEIKGSTGDIRRVRSTFVEEGLSNGGPTGLAAQDIDFIVMDGQSVNVAVVLPLSRSLSNEIYAGVRVEHLPVPQRYKGNGMSVVAPSFPLPKDIDSIEMAKEYIAAQFDVPPENVIKMGESYFQHIAMTPIKIHPFAVAANTKSQKDPDTKFLPMRLLMALMSGISIEENLMSILGKANKLLNVELQIHNKARLKNLMDEKFSGIRRDYVLPTNYRNAPIVRAPLPIQPPPPLKTKPQSEKAKAADIQENNAKDETASMKDKFEDEFNAIEQDIEDVLKMDILHEEPLPPEMK